MKMRIDRVVNIVFFFLLLIEYRFFFLAPLPGGIQKLMNYHNKVILCVLALVLYFIYGVYKNKTMFSSHVYCFITLIFVSTMYSVFTYYPMFNELFFPLCAYSSILLYFPLRRYFQLYFKYFIRLLTAFNIIACTLLTVQWLVYRYKSIVFMNIYEFTLVGKVLTRNNDIRITYLGTTISFSCILSLGILFCSNQWLKQNKLVHLLNFLFSLFYFQYISQTRMYVLTILATVVFVSYLRIDTQNKVFKLVKRILLIMGFIIIFELFGVKDYITEFFRPFWDGSFVENGSYYARLESLNYFLNVIKKNPIFGNGVLSPDRSSIYYNVITGPRGYAFYSDVGILGTAAQFGIPMLIWYISLLIKIIKIIIKKKNAISESLLCFLIFSSGSLIALDPQRIFFLALSLATIEFLYILQSKNKEI